MLQLLNRNLKLPIQGQFYDLEYLPYPVMTSGGRERMRQGGGESFISLSFDTAMSLSPLLLLIPLPGGGGTQLLGETETRGSEHMQ